MNRPIPIVAAGVLLFALGTGAGHFLTDSGGGGGRHPSHAGEAPGEEAQLYTCGMHPNVIQEGPGICPICNMDLTPLRKSVPAGAGAVVIDPAVVQNIGVRTAEARRGALAKTIRATGEIVEDETRVGVVNLKISGWIEKVTVDETGQSVVRGDPLLEIDSPELVTTQEEYRIAWNGVRRLGEDAPAEVRAAARRTLESTKRRLLYWGITEEQIAELERTGEVRRSMTLRSPFTGVVTMKSALPGQKVAPGTDLYHIADLSRVWVEASVFDGDLPFVRLGQEATMTLSYLPGEELTGRVAFLSPVVREKTRDVAIRLEFPNEEGLLKPGMYADVRIRSVLDTDALLVPAESVIRTGKRNVLFIARGDGKFSPTEVLLGPRGEGGVVEVIAGIEEGDRVVTSAQFLLDSESSFQEALRKMQE